MSAEPGKPEPYEPPAVEELNTELGPIETASGTSASPVVGPNN